MAKVCNSQTPKKKKGLLQHHTVLKTQRTKIPVVGVVIAIVEPETAFRTANHQLTRWIALSSIHVDGLILDCILDCSNYAKANREDNRKLF